MNRILATTGLAITLVAGSAIANAANTTTSAAPPAYAAPVIADADAMKAADELHHTNFRQQLQDQLTKAGYTSVKITPSSFFVQAMDKKGDPVAMVVGPDFISEVTEVVSKSPGATAQTDSPNTTAPKN
jgi:uncharacterized iron-regulated membrane protein